MLKGLPRKNPWHLKTSNPKGSSFSTWADAAQSLVLTASTTSPSLHLRMAGKEVQLAFNVNRAVVLLPSNQVDQVKPETTKAV
jgi:hypothetical protein